MCNKSVHFITVQFATALSDDWIKWTPTEAETVVQPQADYKEINLPHTVLQGRLCHGKAEQMSVLLMGRQQ